jgi:hypothetical protein
MLPLTGAKLSVVMLSLRAFGLYYALIVYLPNLNIHPILDILVFGILSPILQVQRQFFFALAKEETGQTKSFINLKKPPGAIFQHLEVIFI